MPEGDTVWRAARSLDRALTNHVITAQFRVPALAEIALTTQVLGTVSRGKHLLTRFATGQTLHTHLRMEGSWHLYRPGEPWQRPGHQARVVLTSDDRVAVGFSLGVVELIATTAESDVVGHLGPDLLGPDWDSEAAVARLSREPTTPIGVALLDQRNLAGIGNLYRNELCFLIGAHPKTEVSRVNVSRVVLRAKALLEANKERANQCTTGDLRPGKRTWVYRRAEQPCRRCGSSIASGELGDPSRSIYWCPSCQPQPTGP